MHLFYNERFKSLLHTKLCALGASDTDDLDGESRSMMSTKMGVPHNGVCLFMIVRISVVNSYKIVIVFLRIQLC